MIDFSCLRIANIQGLERVSGEAQCCYWVLVCPHVGGVRTEAFHCPPSLLPPLLRTHQGQVTRKRKMMTMRRERASQG